MSRFLILIFRLLLILLALCPALLGAQKPNIVFLFTDEYPTKDAERWEELVDRIMVEADQLIRARLSGMIAA